METWACVKKGRFWAPSFPLASKMLIMPAPPCTLSDCSKIMDALKEGKPFGLFSGQFGFKFNGMGLKICHWQAPIPKQYLFT